MAKATLHKPPIYCQTCHKKCADGILTTYITKDADIIFEFVCLKCSSDIQVFKMNFTQAVAYCLCMENTLACYCEGKDEVVH